MPDDVFDRLADRIVGLGRREAEAAAPRFEAFRVTDLDPLSFEDLSGDDAFDEEDDDVTIHRAVWDALEAEPPALAVGDVVEVRETDDGWHVTGVID